nr:Gfo/Idh/MocA family oxidoreductase [bacterium]
MKKRYALVGTGHRGAYSYALPIYQDFADVAQLVALCDKNPLRMAYVAGLVGNPETFTDFDAMLRQTKPDCVVVTTVDATHAGYVVKALRAGCDVLVEKPMCTTFEDCKAILQAERETGHRVEVVFNMRFTPLASKARELILAGAVGKPTHMHMEWFLDRSHGADYYRRWHRMVENSGSLLIHKASHHFDVCNWLLDDEPETVYCLGRRRFYGDANADLQGAMRCRDCTRDCRYRFPLLKNDMIRHLYFEAEQADGYYRDRCIFDPEINIPDTMALTVGYKGGAVLAYSLVSYSPYEGFRATVNGTAGRLEITNLSSGREAGKKQLRVYGVDGSIADYTVPDLEGEHGGSDGLLLKARIRGMEEDP